MRSGVLYQKGKSKSGELNVSGLVKKLKAVAWSLRNFGLILMLLAFGGGGYMFGPLIVQEAGYYLNPVPAQPSSKLGPSLKD
ncbi:MAG: hypothetical protein Q7S31_01515, partial [bacterium]|nr:hypothetical protein [bacterium]